MSSGTTAAASLREDSVGHNFVKNRSIELILVSFSSAPKEVRQKKRKP
uniref:Uncharacterized protein n=1 Tax=Meloidogyne enterolobii TaxID=390850 RepID=A0A6V7UNK3_MELEN|nr:unnamed protein product [Meloidogyne enterolobii]